MKFKSVKTLLIGSIMTLACVHSAVAGIVITGTRVIYPAEEREVIIKLENTGKKPVLMQAWVDSGNPDDTPETASAPFNLTPPVNRINPDKGQSLRLVYTGSDLPQDRESIFWLNVLEIPPKDKTKTNALQMAFRSRLKIFYRPTNLEGNAFQAHEQIQWRKVAGGVTAYNPTPYHVSFVYISSDEKGQKIINDGGMIPPKSSQTFKIKGGASTIYPQYINDYGAINTLPQKVM